MIPSIDPEQFIAVGKMAAAFVVVVLGIAGLVIGVVRWQLGTLTRGQAELFRQLNLQAERLRKLELIMVKHQMDATVILKNGFGRGPHG